MSNPTAGTDRPIRVRIAPSPTGPLHIGTARTALYNYLFAKHTGGTFILRLEDTDEARSTLVFERDILHQMHWLGMEWDEGPEVAGQPAKGPYGPYRQMQRLDRYREVAEQLLAEDKAYHCFCTPEELETRRLKKPRTSHLTTSAAARGSRPRSAPLARLKDASR